MKLIVVLVSIAFLVIISLLIKLMLKDLEDW